MDKRGWREKSLLNRKLIERLRPGHQRARLDRDEDQAELIEKASPETLVSGLLERK
jgi:hypothetical protein